MKKGKINIIEILVGLSMALMTIITAGNVIARKVFSSSFSFVEELVVIMFIGSTLLATALATTKGAHMGFSGIADKLSPKARFVLDLIVEIICCIFFLLILYYGVGMVQSEIATGQTTPALGLPEWIYGLTIPVGGLCIAGAYVVRIVRIFKKKGEDK